jgi:hypothetical protein
VVPSTSRIKGVAAFFQLLDTCRGDYTLIRGPIVSRSSRGVDVATAVDQFHEAADSTNHSGLVSASRI